MLSRLENDVLGNAMGLEALDGDDFWQQKLHHSP